MGILVVLVPTLPREAEPVLLSGLGLLSGVAKGTCQQSDIHIKEGQAIPP